MPAIQRSFADFKKRRKLLLIKDFIMLCTSSFAVLCHDFRQMLRFPIYSEVAVPLQRIKECITFQSWHSNTSQTKGAPLGENISLELWQR